MEGRNVGRLRTTTSGKRLIWSHRVAARSDRWPRNLACAIRCCAVGRATWARRERMAASRRPTTQATLPSADHPAEIARLQRENERLRMERDILKTSMAIFAGVQK
jgi:transposase-like protein